MPLNEKSFFFIYSITINYDLINANSQAYRNLLYIKILLKY